MLPQKKLQSGSLLHFKICCAVQQRSLVLALASHMQGDVVEKESLRHGEMAKALLGFHMRLLRLYKEMAHLRTWCRSQPQKIRNVTQ